MDAGSTSEMYPFQANVGCGAGTGTHIISDEVYPEIVDKDDLNVPVPDGERGALVYTHLWRDSQPMIRFAPGDESYLTPRAVPLRPHLSRDCPRGCSDASTTCSWCAAPTSSPAPSRPGCAACPGFGPEFSIHVFKRGALDEIVVRAECESDVAADAAARERAQVEAEATLKKLTGIRVPVEVIDPGTLPSTVFKARRVVDERPRP